MKTLYLLTGAAGFLGSNICSQLLGRGDRVRAFVLRGDPAVKYIPEGVEIFEGDLCSAEDCGRFFAVEEDGITEYSPADLNTSFQAIALSRNTDDLLALFADKNYVSCTKRLAEKSIETTPSEFDLIQDILGCSEDKRMGADPHAFVASCDDGFRPVSFLLEAMEEEAPVFLAE